MRVEPLKGTITIKIADITISEDRKLGELDDIAGLIDSIKLNGLINPIVVDKEKKLIDGFRRLKALTHLKEKEVDARFYENLSDFARQRIRVESELQKKRLTWQEETELKSKLHTLYTREFGGGPGGNRKKKGPRAEKKWGQKQNSPGSRDCQINDE